MGDGWYFGAMLVFVMVFTVLIVATIEQRRRK